MCYDNEKCPDCGETLDKVMDSDGGGNRFLDCFWCPKCKRFVETSEVLDD